MSPAAYTPGTSVSMNSFVRMRPSSVQATCPRTSPDAGTMPTAANTPETGSVRSAPVRTSLTVSPSTFSSPTNASATLWNTNSTFSSANAACWSDLAARSSPRRCTTYTRSTNRARYSASEMAVSPPPTTATCFPLKNAPSHVAQYDTPLPVSSASRGSPSGRGLAPMARITVRASTVWPSTTSFLTSPAKSTDSTVAYVTASPKRAACCSSSTPS